MMREAHLCSLFGAHVLELPWDLQPTYGLLVDVLLLFLVLGQDDPIEALFLKTGLVDEASEGPETGALSDVLSESLLH